jgi:hypothetical protein
VSCGRIDSILFHWGRATIGIFANQ